MYNYKIQVIKVVDGDTIDAHIDLGFDVSIKNRIRLSGIDAPESRTRNLTEKKYGLEAKEKLRELLTHESDVLTVQSHGLGKYGRVLGTLYAGDKNINETMISEGYAIGYQGDRKIDPPELLKMLDAVRSCQQ